MDTWCRESDSSTWFHVIISFVFVRHIVNERIDSREFHADPIHAPRTHNRSSFYARSFSIRAMIVDAPFGTKYRDVDRALSSRYSLSTIHSRYVCVRHKSRPEWMQARSFWSPINSWLRLNVSLIIASSVDLVSSNRHLFHWRNFTCMCISHYSRM